MFREDHKKRITVITETLRTTGRDLPLSYKPTEEELSAFDYYPYNILIRPLVILNYIEREHEIETIAHAYGVTNRTISWIIEKYVPKNMRKSYVKRSCED